MRNDRGQVVHVEQPEVTLTPIAFELYRAASNFRKVGVALITSGWALNLVREVRAADDPDRDDMAVALEPAAELADFLGL